ncbi:hypothetical protein [Micromonospora rifamycinica]|uniref:Uncharacterized protein n=1 Tax=Micromonospora rifamycinica TaxID=291594 RepID=A0A109IPS8_9ACTN|nr:hypothetical protein [Micromonospora rifamycinica]KWV34434.1 hypothetical protein AWV63_01660 [Micromonospora rifamycinica]SCG73840.1 hypothetical protein GA0070623_3825 [Micromonospora rifamycinica]
MPPTPAPRPPRRRPVVARLVVAVLAVLPFAGCAAPPERRVAVPVAPPTPVVPPTTPPTALAVLPTLPPTTTPPAATPTAATVAVPCAGRPSTERVIGLLRDDVLPRNVSVRAVQGPLCADGWHYTVLAVSGHEQLQAVSRGEPGGAVVLVTAGTDVCSIEVKAAAPPAIRTLACDAGTGVPPGA